ncbi:MAG: stimulus-sensing domain-containing protein, partial [Alphaproteobacteria bacterium]
PAGAIKRRSMALAACGSSDSSIATLRRLIAPAGDVRARLFISDGTLLVDSRTLTGPSASILTESLPPPARPSLAGRAVALVERLLLDWTPGYEPLPVYREQPVSHADDYAEASRALRGTAARAVRASEDGGLILSYAVPVQRYRQVAGSLLLTTDDSEIVLSLRDVRRNVLALFALAMAVSIVLSLYLARAISRPIRRLAAAADRVRRGQGQITAIPDFSRRRDEIGELSSALRDMTEALAQRMTAIEAFAADVAHEIKNPLSSLRSAVETAARLHDHQQQEKLMAIIEDDVRRLDRLITDISEASRVDAEMARAEGEPVDMYRLAEAFADSFNSGALGDPDRRQAADRPVVRLEPGPEEAANDTFTVQGAESRLGQVLRNLLANAESFSPPRGIILLRLSRQRDFVRLEVMDQGPGIPPGKEEAVFGRFYSDRPAGEAFGRHSGLGLSISRQIAENHDGSLTVRNRRDGDDGAVTGACFVLDLPIPD